MNRTSPIPVVLALGLGFALLADPQAAASGFADGLRLCMTGVLPALFPFFVICELVMAAPGAEVLALPLRGPARRLGLRHPSAALALLLSWLGGYGVCAQTVRRLRPRLSEREAQLLLLLGCCSGPGFVVGSVGGLLLGSVRLGALLYGLQLAANLLAAAPVSLFLSPAPAGPVGGHGSAQAEAEAPPAPVSLPAAISHGVDSSLSVCGCVIFFRIAGAVLGGLLPDGPFLSAVLEVSAGCAGFAAVGGRAGLYGCCLCLSLLGLSVWMQLRLLLDGCLPLLPLAAARGLHALIYPLLVGLCVRALPGTAAVFSSLEERVVTASRLPPDAALVCAIFLCAALYKGQKNFYNKDC